MSGRHIDVLKNVYARLPSSLRDGVPERLEAWLRDHIAPGVAIGRHGAAVARLERKLWGGFSRSALAELDAMRADPAAGAGRFAAASYVLAQWHAAQGEFAQALDLLAKLRHRQPARLRDPRQYSFEAMFLCRLGRGAEARALLDAAAGTKSGDTALALIRATSWSRGAGATEPDAGARALAQINGIFRRHGLAELARHDAGAPLTLDNLRAAAELPARHGPLVTVIVPLWNAADTVETALRGLAAQTYQDLEVLVVDDRSDDGSDDRAAAFCRADPRFRLIRSRVNGGPYMARNLALAEATGAYITCHDADDWSHPERIARQLDHLARRRVPFNLSNWARTSTDLCFWGTWRPSPRQLAANFSSVLFRRDLTDRVGPWDEVRVSADREFVNRCEAALGLAHQQPMLADCPLAFGRLGEGTLTRIGATHVASMHHGLRREYHEVNRIWHDELGVRRRAQKTRHPGPADLRNPYPRPRSILPAGAAEPPRDLIFIGDFNLYGGTQKSALAMMEAARRAGLSAAMLQYRRHDLDAAKPLDTAIRRFAWAHDIRIVAPGEHLQAGTVIVTYPPIFDQAMDRFPRIDHDRLAIVVNQMAERDDLGRDVAYDIGRVTANLTGLLGSAGLWIPISERVRQVMTGDPRYPAPSAETWTPLIDTDAWCARTPSWRGDTGRRPVIGRHGRDHRLKWPSDPAELRAAYCAGKPCEVRFLGGARFPRRSVSPWPSNWKSKAFGAEEVRDFLAGLDVFIHYPDATYIEEFGRAPMEAMAVGVPVILPPVFAPTFGDAALYAAPDEVWDVIDALWRDRTAWEARVAAGRAFVRATCSHAAFAARIERLRAADRTVPRAVNAL